MFFYEGIFLLVVIIGGGASLIFFSHTDQKRTDQLKVFLSTFSHDIKTAISRMRVKSDLGETEGLNVELQRLELQLENALLLSTFEKSLFLKEKVVLSEVISQMRPLFPDLSFYMSQDCELSVDRRVFINALRNFFQNSVLHAKATNIHFNVEKGSQARVRIDINDDGGPFRGDTDLLGKKVIVGTANSGSGIGLYLSRILIEKIGGSLFFDLTAKENLKITMILPGSLK